MCIYYIGIAHMDISMENIMLKNVGLNQLPKVKIIDFGLAHNRNKLHTWMSNRAKIGKLTYMSPEVYYADKFKYNYWYDTRKADVWCLGVMLFVMLTGSPLYDTAPDHLHCKLCYDPSYDAIDKILKHWNRERLVPDTAKDLLRKILTPEYKRYII